MEEIYVVISGSGRVKLDDEIEDVGPLDAIRIAPSVIRAFEAGDDDLVLLVFSPGPRATRRSSRTSPGTRPSGRSFITFGACRRLISFEEALELGRPRTDHEEIGALVERAWEVRQDRFGDSTDMCSLVNAKSGGCAEDCGFCAQSRYAEADTPMHAMMEPEQILEHAKAAEAAGAHRFCMVTQGQGLSKRDFAKILEGARLVSEHTNLKRCASIGHMSADRAQQLKEAGIQRVHHNVESSRSYYPEVSTTVRYEGRMRTIDAVNEAGLETCVGGILNLGESPRQRVEMAFELAEIDPDSVPINLLNPRAGTKFGDRELMDPWEVVKWVAIFRLILPDALFRLCGGPRREPAGPRSRWPSRPASTA